MDMKIRKLLRKTINNLNKIENHFNVFDYVKLPGIAGNPLSIPSPDYFDRDDYQDLRNRNECMMLKHEFIILKAEILSLKHDIECLKAEKKLKQEENV